MKRRCPICGRYLKKENKYDACDYPRYCFEKQATKEYEPLARAVEFLIGE